MSSKTASRNANQRPVRATSGRNGAKPGRSPGAQVTTCPFCALLCDDVSVRPGKGAQFTVQRHGCSRAEADYARAPAAFEPLVEGRPAGLDAAVEAVAGLLKRARQPLLGGLATDVNGMRAAVRLAERCGATLDHMHGEALADTAALVQSRGWYTTTLSEVRNRADVILLVGVDLDDRYENLVRRCLAPATALAPKRLAERRIVSIGGGATPADPALKCRPENLAVALNGLLAALRGAPLAARAIGGVPRKALTELAATLRASSYCAVVFASGPLGASRPAALQTIGDLVSELNRDGRAAALPLGGDDGGQTAVGVCTWMTGYPLRVRLGKTLAYDPNANAAGTLVASGAADALLWIDAFGRHPNPPRGAEPKRTVILSAVRPAAARRAAVWIPVGTPGVDHPARLLRTDAVVTLPLPALRDVGLPSVETVLRRVSAAL